MWESFHSSDCNRLPPAGPLDGCSVRRSTSLFVYLRKGSETTAMTIDKYFRLKTVGFRQINKEYQYLTSYDMVIYG